MGCSLRKPTTSLDAYDLYMRGLAAFRNLSPDRLHLTMELTRKTIDLPLLPAGYRAAAVALVVSTMRRNEWRSCREYGLRNASAPSSSAATIETRRRRKPGSLRCGSPDCRTETASPSLDER